LYGYTGRLLRVDLTEGKVSTEKVVPELLRKFLGGVGYGAKLYYDEIPAGVDSLSPQNKLIFTTGPLSGTKAPGAGPQRAGNLSGKTTEAGCSSGPFSLHLTSSSLECRWGVVLL